MMTNSPIATAPITTDQKGFKKSLGLLDATMILAGSMIGSGIFIVSSEIARSVGSSGYFLLMWILAGTLFTILFSGKKTA